MSATKEGDAEMCTKCGMYPQSTRKGVQKGLCCNRCPNHGPWCSSHTLVKKTTNPCKRRTDAIPQTASAPQQEQPPHKKMRLTGQWGCIIKAVKDSKCLPTSACDELFTSLSGGRNDSGEFGLERQKSLQMLQETLSGIEAKRTDDVRTAEALATQARDELEQYERTAADAKREAAEGNADIQAEALEQKMRLLPALRSVAMEVIHKAVDARKRLEDFQQGPQALFLEMTAELVMRHGRHILGGETSSKEGANDEPAAQQRSRDSQALREDSHVGDAKALNNRDVSQSTTQHGEDSGTTLQDSTMHVTDRGAQECQERGDNAEQRSADAETLLEDSTAGQQQRSADADTLLDDSIMHASDMAKQEQCGTDADTLLDDSTMHASDTAGREQCGTDADTLLDDSIMHASDTAGQEQRSADVGNLLEDSRIHTAEIAVQSSEDVSEARANAGHSGNSDTLPQDVSEARANAGHSGNSDTLPQDSATHMADTSAQESKEGVDWKSSQDVGLCQDQLGGA